MRPVVNQRSTRRGFTMIEVSVGIIASSFLLLGLAGSLFLATQANRIDLGPFRNSSQAAAALDEMHRELSYATKVRAVTPGRSIEVEVPDRTGDGNADVVRYQWSGTPGTPLQRQFNGQSASNVASAIEAFDLTTTSRTVTAKEIGTVSNTSGDGRWYEKTGALLLEGTVSIQAGDGVGTDFLPTLPEGATSWTLRKVDVRCQSEGTKSGVVKARVWTADGDRRPATMLAEATINEASLPASWVWLEVTFSPPPTFSANQRACITFQYHSGTSVVMNFREDLLGLALPFWKLSTSNSGSTWSHSVERAMYLRINGSYTYPMGGLVDVNRTYQTSVGLQAQAGTDPTSKMTGTTRLRNQVEAP